MKPMPMVHCPNCGAYVEERLNRCNQCGAAFLRIELCSKKQLAVGLSVWIAIVMLTQIVSIILFGKPFYGGGQWGAGRLVPAFFGTIWISRYLALKYVTPLYKLETMLTQEEERSMKDAYNKLSKRHDKNEKI